jgi:hypothetical protein
LANGPWEKRLLCTKISSVTTRQLNVAGRRTEAPAARPEDKIRRYMAAREKLEQRRRHEPGRFAQLRRMHD